MKNKKIIYVDIDNTICSQVTDSQYQNSVPWYDNIKKINKLYENGNYIKYWTARGSTSGNDYYKLTKNQLDKWGAKYHELSAGEKPFYDLLICDRTKRIEEI
jgi:hypothetical protein|tara:strand:+ start:219 stop:524 length:306 start_codon:yes stop_codon:yes gene_type:complete